MKGINLPFVDVDGNSDCLEFYEGNDVYGGVTPASSSSVRKPSPQKTKGDLSDMKFDKGKWEPSNTRTIDEKFNEVKSSTLKPSMKGADAEVSPVEYTEMYTCQNKELTVSRKLDNKPMDIIKFDNSKKDFVNIEAIPNGVRKVIVINEKTYGWNETVETLTKNKFPELIVEISQDRYIYTIEGQWIKNEKHQLINNESSPMFVSGGSRWTDKSRTSSFMNNEIIEKGLQESPHWNITDLNGKNITLISKDAPSVKKSKQGFQPKWIYLEGEGSTHPMKLMEDITSVNYDRTSISTSSVKDLRNLQDLNMDVVRELYFYKEAGGIYYNNSGKLINLTKGNKNKKASTNLAKEILSLDSKMTIISSSKNKGVSVKKGRIIELPSNAKKEDIRIAKEVRKQIDKDAHLGDIYSQIDKITSKDIAILSRIPEDQIYLKEDYLKLRALDKNDLSKDHAAVSIRTTGETSAFLFKKENNDIVFHQIGSGRKIDFKNALEKLYDANNLRQFKKETIREFQVLEDIRSVTKAKTIITVEHEGIDAAKLWALHDGDASFKIRRDNPDMKESIAYYKEKVVPSLSETVLLLDKSPDKDTVIDSLAYFKTDTLMYPTKLTFTETLLNPKYTQVILDLNVRYGSILLKDGSLSYEDFIAILSKVKDPKKVIYILGRNAKELQSLVSKTGKAKRILYSENNEYGKKNLYTYLSKLIENVNRSSGKNKTVNELYDEILQENEKDFFRKNRKRDKSFEFKSLELFKGIPDLKASSFPEQYNTNG